MHRAVSGKTNIVASTGGNKTVGATNVIVGVNMYTKGGTAFDPNGAVPSAMDAKEADVPRPLEQAAAPNADANAGRRKRSRSGEL